MWNREKCLSGASNMSILSFSKAIIKGVHKPLHKGLCVRSTCTQVCAKVCTVRTKVCATVSEIRTNFSNFQTTATMVHEAAPATKKGSKKQQPSPAL